MFPVVVELIDYTRGLGRHSYVGLGGSFIRLMADGGLSLSQPIAGNNSIVGSASLIVNGDLKVEVRILESVGHGERWRGESDGVLNVVVMSFIKNERGKSPPHLNRSISV